MVWGLGSPILIYVRLLLYFLLILCLPKRSAPRISKSIGIVLLFVLYVLLLSFLNTSSIITSFDSALKIIFSFLLYVYCILHIKNQENFLKFSKFNFISLIVILGCIGLSNIFQFGEINYKDSSIYFGAAGVNIVKNVYLFGLLSIPYIFFAASKKIKFIGYFSFFSGIILILLATKRSLFVILILSLVLLFYYNRRNFSKLFFPSLLALTVGLFFFRDKITERIDNRAEAFSVSDGEEIEEWRIIETEIVLKKYNEGSLLTKFFGNETFNEYNAYDLPYMFHNDFAVLLGSTGLVGLFMYLFFLATLVFWYKKNFSVTEQENTPIYKWMFASLIIGLIVFGISGNLKVLGSSLSISLAGLGGIQSSMKIKGRC